MSQRFQRIGSELQGQNTVQEIGKTRSLEEMSYGTEGVDSSFQEDSDYDA